MSDDILSRMRSLIEDHSPTGWPAVRACEISALCDEITRLRAAIAAAQPPAPVKESLTTGAQPPAAMPDMRHPKIQALIGAKARREIELQLVEQLIDEGPDCELTSMDMEYWHGLHDKLKAALEGAQAQSVPATGAQPWQPIETAPDDRGSYLVANATHGMVAPCTRGVIHNNPGTAHDWQYGVAITHWMPLPTAPTGSAG